MIEVVVAMAILPRALPRIACPDSIPSDTWFHLYCARAIREARLRVPRELPRIVLPHEHTYPFLYHVALALFPEPARRIAERWTGAVLDACLVLAAWLFATWLEGATGRDSGGLLPLLAAAVFAFSPALLRLGSGPRAYNGSPRVLGQLLYFIHITLAVHAWFADSIVSLTVSAVAGAALLLSAKFSVQVMLLFGLFVAALVTPLYLILLAAAIMLAHVLSAGRAWRVFVGHYRHSKFYATVLQRVFLHPHRQGFAEYWGRLRHHLAHALRSRQAGGVWTWLLSENYRWHLLAVAFTPFLLAPVWLQDFPRMSGPERLLAAWALAGLAYFLVFQVRRLAFLGEAERYLEYALFPAVLLGLLSLPPGWHWLAWAYLGYCLLAAWHFSREYVRRNADQSRDFPAAQRVCDALCALEVGVVMPIGSHHWEALCRTSFPILTIGVNIDDTLLPREDFALVYGAYPYPSSEFEAIVERFQVRYVYSDKASLDHYARNIVKDPDRVYSRLEPIAESQAVVIYRVRP